MMSGDVHTTWEFPGHVNNPANEDSRFMNGSHLDRSMKEKKRHPSVKLKDPPVGSIQPDDARGHRRLSSEGIKPRLLARGEMQMKQPPNPHNRRKSDGDGVSLFPPAQLGGEPRIKTVDAGGGVEPFIVDSIPLSPMRTVSSKKQPQGGIKDAQQNSSQGDSITCSETKSVSDSSSSLQSPTENGSRESGSSAGSMGTDRDVFVEMNPDISGLSYATRPRKSLLKDAPIPQQVEDPRSRHSRSGPDYHSRREISPRRPRDDDDDAPPPLAPYQDDRRRAMPIPRHSDRYNIEPDPAGGFHDSRSSRMHDSRSRFDDASSYGGERGGGPYDHNHHHHPPDHHHHYEQGPPPHYDPRYERGPGYERDRYEGEERYSRHGPPPPSRYDHHHHDYHHHHHHPDRSHYEDDNVSRMSRSSRYHPGDRSVASRHYEERSVGSRHYDERSRYEDDSRRYEEERRWGSRHEHHHHHHHGRRDDEEMSQISRSSRYHGGCDRSVASSRFPTDRSIAIGGGRSVVSRLDDDISRHSTRSSLSVSHMSRYEMDKPTRYHNDRPQRSYYNDEASHCSSRYHHHPHHGHLHHSSHHQRGDHYDDRSRRSHYDDPSRRSHFDRGDEASYHSSRYHPDDRPRDHHYHHAERRPSRTEYHEGQRHRDDYYSGSRHSRHESYDGRREGRYRERRYSGHGGGDYDRRGGREEYDRRGIREEEYEGSYDGGREERYQGGSRHGGGYDEDYEDRRRRGDHSGSRHSRQDDHRSRRGERKDDQRPDSAEDLYEEKIRKLGILAELPSRGDIPPFASAKPDSKSSPEAEVYVDIGFGTKARLRRTKETMDAIARDFYSPCKCLACSTELFCIADVKYIVCPKCKTISPAEQAAGEGEGGTATSLDGSPVPRQDVGLGFTYDTLYKMQSDVAKERGDRRKVAST